MTDARNATAADSAPIRFEPPAFDHVFVTVAAETLAQINGCPFRCRSTAPR